MLQDVLQNQIILFKESLAGGDDAEIRRNAVAVMLWYESLSDVIGREGAYKKLMEIVREVDG